MKSDEFFYTKFIKLCILFCFQALFFFIFSDFFKISHLTIIFATFRHFLLTFISKHDMWLLKFVFHTNFEGGFSSQISLIGVEQKELFSTEIFATDTQTH